MPNASATLNASDFMTILSRLLLSNEASAQFSQTATELRTISRENFEGLLALANSNHVIVRGMEVFGRLMREAGDETRAGWAAEALEEEQARIAKALKFLHAICRAFETEGLDVTVIKSLDHLPDLGSDLDLYTNATTAQVCDLMSRQFGAKIAPRSWGDRLACKWNFEIPGLPESVEVHTGRLGQTGEQMVLAAKLPGRSRVIEVSGQKFRVCSVADRLMISTLQRMYRHFYFRLCDMVDSATLVCSGAVNFQQLRAWAEDAGIWEGVASYLMIVSDYVRQYQGEDLGLPQFVKDTARFGGDVVYFGKEFIRVPIMPQGAALYRSQMAGLLRKGELHSSARLGLFPWLATAAAVGMKITGSDKGIW